MECSWEYFNKINMINEISKERKLTNEFVIMIYNNNNNNNNNK